MSDDSKWIMPEDADYPHASIPENPDLPYIPIKRKGWFFDLRSKSSPTIFHDGQIVGRVQKVAFKIDAHDARMMTAHLVIADPDFVISLEDDAVEVETVEQPEP
jgi:hypothetical protein